MRLLSSLVGLFCVAVIGGGCHPSRPNVVLVVIDTLRADRVGAMTGTSSLTPFLDELAASGVAFTQAYAQSSWTLPSVASLLTSRYQTQHGLVTFMSVLSEEEVTLPELLREAGYSTLGFSANVLINERQGMQQGFDMLESHRRDLTAGHFFSIPYERAATLNRKAKRALGKIDRRRPLFLYLHYMEPHFPFAPPETMLDAVRGSAERPDLHRVNTFPLLGDSLSPAQLADWKIAYDAEIRQIDAELRTMFGWLQSEGFLDGAIVVVTSDHGEELHDHGRLGHARTLYEEVLRVPLIIKTAASGRGRVVDRRVSLVDVAPTIMELAGLHPPPTFSGRSLCFLVGPPTGCGPRERREPSDDIVFSELLQSTFGEAKHRRALITRDGKLLTSSNGEEDRFFDLDVDPGEQNPAAVPPNGRARLRRTLRDFISRTSQTRTDPPKVEFDEADRERLRQLGYIK